MDQLSNAIIAESNIRQRQNDLLNTRRLQQITTRSPQRSLRGKVGTVLIRFGESIRGHSETLSPAEADRNLAYHLSA